VADDFRRQEEGLLEEKRTPPDRQTFKERLLNIRDGGGCETPLANFNRDRRRQVLPLGRRSPAVEADLQLSNCFRLTGGRLRQRD